MDKKDNTGALFKNENKQTQNHPDYKGEITVNGSEYWISSWINTSKNGKKYMSIKANKKEEKVTLKEFQSDEMHHLDEDIPF